MKVDCNLKKLGQIYLLDFSFRLDFLKITNEKNDFPSLHCGQKAGHTVLVIGEVALMTFHSDPMITREGFLIHFDAVSHSKNPPGGSHLKVTGLIVVPLGVQLVVWYHSGCLNKGPGIIYHPEPKRGGWGGSLNSLEGLKGEPLKSAWTMPDMVGGGGDQESYQFSCEEDQFNEIAFKGKIGEISPCLAQNPPTPQAIDNDRSLKCPSYFDTF